MSSRGRACDSWSCGRVREVSGRPAQKFPVQRAECGADDGMEPREGEGAGGATDCRRMPLGVLRERGKRIVGFGVDGRAAALSGGAGDGAVAAVAIPIVAETARITESIATVTETLDRVPSPFAPS